MIRQVWALLRTVTISDTRFRTPGSPFGDSTGPVRLACVTSDPGTTAMAVSTAVAQPSAVASARGAVSSSSRRRRQQQQQRSGPSSATHSNSGQGTAGVSRPGSRGSLTDDLAQYAFTDSESGGDDGTVCTVSRSSPVSADAGSDSDSSDARPRSRTVSTSDGGGGTGTGAGASTYSSRSESVTSEGVRTGSTGPAGSPVTMSLDSMVLSRVRELEIVAHVCKEDGDAELAAATEE